ncbi:MAG: zinc ribbon domain-containing protein [Candidatus Methylomirabilales bacterium]
MPIYEYDCDGCRRRVSLLILNIHSPPPLRCPHCGSDHLTRLLSRFARPRSDAERLERLGDPSGLGDLDENDPQSVRRWATRMGKELGDELGEDFEPMMEEALRDEGATEGAPEAEP